LFILLVIVPWLLYPALIKWFGMGDMFGVNTTGGYVTLPGDLGTTLDINTAVNRVALGYYIWISILW